MNEVLTLLGLFGGFLGAIAAAFVAVRKVPSEVHLTEAQERKLAIETEMLVTQTIRELRIEIEEMRRKLAEAETAAIKAQLSEKEARAETLALRARLAELEKEMVKLNRQLDTVQRRQGILRTRIEDTERECNDEEGPPTQQ